MKINLNGCGKFIDETQYEGRLDAALKALQTLENGDGAGNDFLGWNHLPSSTSEDEVRACEQVAGDWRQMGVNLVVVIGIGGSYLGAKAALEAMSHSFSAQMGKNEYPQVVFAGQNLSEEYLSELMDLVLIKNVAAVVISKSGTTTEPAVAFRVIKGYIEDRYGEDEACRRIVAVTDKARGALKSLADREGYRTFVIEDNIGGRFSVLSPVGLLPVAVAGFDIRQLLRGACAMEKECSAPSKANIAVRYAAMRNLLYGLGKKIELLVSFNPKLQYVGEWWKQLFGESEGKEGQGIFPASVNFTTDLHSMGQYIQDGERTLFETVICVKESSRRLVVERDGQDLDGLNFLAGKRVEYCNEMARLGTKLAHIDGGVPNIELEIERIDEFNLGQLFYFFEKSCGISAYMAGINPFNQPGVEAYKKNMFALLEKPGYESQSEVLRKRLDE